MAKNIMEAIKIRHNGFSCFVPSLEEAKEYTERYPSASIYIVPFSSSLDDEEINYWQWQ